MKQFLKTIGGIALGLLFLALMSGIPLAMFWGMQRSMHWIDTTLLPWSIAGAWLALIPVCLPCAIILAIFRKTRGLAGLIMILASYAIGFSLWLYGLVAAASLAGYGWMCVGLFLAGIGVLPIAFIAAVFSGHWSVVATIAILTLIVYVLRVSGHWLVDRAEEARYEVKPLPPPISAYGDLLLPL